MAASPQLAAAPDLARTHGLGTDDVMAVRLWLDGAVRPATASNVVVGFDAGVGATVFDLSSLQARLGAAMDSARKSIGEASCQPCVRVKPLVATPSAWVRSLTRPTWA